MDFYARLAGSAKSATRGWQSLGTLGLGLLVCGAGPAQARIGDSAEQLTARVVKADLGKTLVWPPRDASEEERRRLNREHPTHAFAHLLPEAGEDTRELVFWKSARAGHLSQDDGWRLHAYFLKGRSVLECYRRVGAGLNEAEVNAILGRVKGARSWRRVPEAERGPSVVGYEFELGEPNDAVLRARRQGDWLVIYDRRLDELLLARREAWDASEARRKAEERARAEQGAPESVDGF
jgi:hypothetical protein